MLQLEQDPFELQLFTGSLGRLHVNFPGEHPIELTAKFVWRENLTPFLAGLLVREITKLTFHLKNLY